MDGIAYCFHADKMRLREHYLTLTESQKQFVDVVINWYKNPRKLIVIVSGGPGTGKSFVVQSTLDLFKVQQLRMSFTARSAVAIKGQTIHSAVKLHWGPDSVYKYLEKKLENEIDLQKAIDESQEISHEFQCTLKPQIIVVDEVAMINGWLIYWLITYFMERATKPILFVAMGDPHQLNPVRSKHNLFSINLFEKKYDLFKIPLLESKRFSLEYEKLINRLRAIVDKGDETSLFSFVCQHFPVVSEINGELLKNAERAMAFRNDRVKTYNTFYIEQMMTGPPIQLDDKLIVKTGCWVFVTKNGCSRTAMNGTELIFQKLENDCVICTNPKENNEEVVIRRDENKRFPLVVGFCGTVHKFQGDTMDDDKIVISFDDNRNLHLVYTALSRVRGLDQILAIAL